METLVDVHSWVRWLVLLGLVSGTGLALSRHLKGEGWESGYFSAAVIALDIQVLIGMVLYLGNRGWDQSTFISVFHPILMFTALAVAHVALRYARTRPEEEPNKAMGYGLFVTVVLVIAGVPWDRLAG